MISASDVLRVVETQGPIIPNRIKQALQQTDSSLVNVYLSQLREEGRIEMTHLQLGSSAFAYTPAQRAKLANLVEHLNEKDKRVARRLQQDKVMRASAQDPLTRVALQSIKDFARPMQVTSPHGEEVYYRWYELSVEDARSIIASELGGVRKEPQETPKASAPEAAPRPAPAEPTTAPPAPEPTPAPKPETSAPKKEQQASLKQEEMPESAFGALFLQYCKDKRIVIEEIKEVRKDSEIEATIAVPTAVGVVRFFCKARNKKSSNDGDLASAILSAKARMLPAMYFTTGSVTRRALENPELQEITVMEWEQR